MKSLEVRGFLVLSVLLINVILWSVISHYYHNPRTTWTQSKSGALEFAPVSENDGHANVSQTELIRRNIIFRTNNQTTGSGTKVLQGVRVSKKDNELNVLEAEVPRNERGHENRIEQPSRPEQAENTTGISGGVSSQTASVTTRTLNGVGAVSGEHSKDTTESVKSRYVTDWLSEKGVTEGDKMAARKSHRDIADSGRLARVLRTEVERKVRLQTIRLTGHMGRARRLFPTYLTALRRKVFKTLTYKMARESFKKEAKGFSNEARETNIGETSGSLINNRLKPSCLPPSLWLLVDRMKARGQLKLTTLQSIVWLLCAAKRKFQTVVPLINSHYAQALGILNDDQVRYKPDKIKDVSSDPVSKMLDRKMESLQSVLRLCNKSKDMLKHWKKNVLKLLSNISQSLAFGGHHEVKADKPNVNNNLHRSEQYPISRLPGRNTPTSNQFVVALFTSIISLLENQRKQIKKLNISLVLLKRELVRNHTQSTYPLTSSMKQFFNATFSHMQANVLINISFYSAIVGFAKLGDAAGGDRFNIKSLFQAIAESIRKAITFVNDFFRRCHQSLKLGFSLVFDKVGLLRRDTFMNWFSSKYKDPTSRPVVSAARNFNNETKTSIATKDHSLDTVSIFELRKLSNGSRKTQESVAAVRKSRKSEKSGSVISFEVNSTASNSDNREVHPIISQKNARISSMKPIKLRNHQEIERKKSLRDSISSSLEASSILGVKDAVKILIKNIAMRKIAREKFNRALDSWESKRDNSIASEDSGRFKSKTNKLAQSYRKKKSLYFRRLLKFVKNLLKGETLRKFLESLRKKRITKTFVNAFDDKNETVGNKGRVFPTSGGRDLIFSRNGLERLVYMWRAKTRQMARLLAWLVSLPQRTLSFIRRLELANLKLRMIFFKQVLLVHVDSLKQGGGDQKGTERAKQREAFRKAKKFTPLKNEVYQTEEPDEIARSQIDEKGYYGKSYKETLRPERNQELRENKNSHVGHSLKTNALELGNLTQFLKIFNNDSLKEMKVAKESFHFLGSNNTHKLDNFGELRRKTSQTHMRIKRSPFDDRNEEARDSEILKKLSEIANRRKIKLKPARLKMHEDSDRWVKTSGAENTATKTKEVASALQSKLLKMIQIMESHRQSTTASPSRALPKKSGQIGVNRNNIDGLGEKAGVSEAAIDVDPKETLLSASSSLKPTEADYELLDNIELLTEKFLNIKKKKKIVALDEQPNDDADQSNRRRKRSDGEEEVLAEDLPDPSEISQVDRLKETGMVEKVKDPKQFLHKWATLRKQAENLKTEVNSARDKYASASDELDTLLKKGNELHERVVSAGSDQGMYKSKLEENWKNANKEFEKFKSDMSAREKEILSEDNRVSPERVDKVMLKLEDAVSEQGDPTDRILGENPVAPFDVDYSKLGPAVENMKDAETIAEQASSKEVTLESEDYEDDIFKRSEAGDYSLIDIDYGPDAKFVDEEDDQMAEDADALTGFDYEIDRHSDSQLEDVDNMLSRLIARRFRSKREVNGLGKVSPQPDTTRNNISQSELFFPVTEETKSESAMRENASFTTGSRVVNQTRFHSLERRSSLDDVEQALNYDDEYEGNAEEQPDFGDMVKDIEGQRLIDATMDLSADNAEALNVRINHSNPASRFVVNHLTDVNINREMKRMEKTAMEEGKRPSNIVAKDKKYLASVRARQSAAVQNQLDADGKALGINTKSLRKEIRKLNPDDVVEIPLGSNSDIEEGIEEIKREKEYLSTPYEHIDEDIFLSDDLEPFDQAISEISEEDVAEIDYDEPEDDSGRNLWRRRNSLEKSQQDLVDAEEEKQKFMSASNAQRQRQRDKLQHEAELEEIERDSKNLDRAMSDLSKATNEVEHLPPRVRPSKEEQVRSLYVEDAMDVERALRRNKSLITSRLNDSDSLTRDHRVGLGRSGVLLLKKRSSADEKTSLNFNESLPAKSLIKNVGVQSSTENVTKHLVSAESRVVVGVEDDLDTAARVERDANLTGTDTGVPFTTAGMDAIDLGVDAEDDTPLDDTGVYEDDVMHSEEDDDEVRMEGWAPTPPPRKQNKGKKKVKDDELVDDTLVDAKAVVRKMKEEEETAGDLLPHSTPVDSDRVLMEFGRNPDMKDVFYEKFRPAVAELNEDELRALDGPVLSATNIEKELEDPTEILSGLEEVENEIEDRRLSLMSQARDLGREASGGYISTDPAGRAVADGATSDEAVDEVFRQISSEEGVGNEALEKKAAQERYDLLDDMRKARLRQKAAEAEDEGVEGEMLGERYALNEALQDLEQVSFDSDMDKLRTFVDFKDARQMKENEKQSEETL